MDYTVYIFIAAIILLVLFTLSWYYKFKFADFGKKISKIPGPPPIPLLGNVLQLGFSPTEILTHFYKWSCQYGGIYRMIVGRKVILVISSPEYLEKILTSTTLIQKGDDYRFFGDWLGDGLLTSTGAKWRSRRKLLTPAFHFHILHQYLDIFNQQSLKLVDEFVKTGGSTKGVIKDICPLITRSALDIICETAMGVSGHSQSDYSDYAQAICGISNIVVKRTFQPWLTNNLVFYLTPIGWKYRVYLKTIHRFVDKVIQERKQVFDAHMEPDNAEDDLLTRRKLSFLDLLIKTSRDGANLTDVDIKDEVNTFMFRGHDTNSAAMSWFLFLMAKYPEHQERVYEELREVFGDSDHLCTLPDIARLKYLECCIKETLRICPSVPFFERETTEEISFGKYTIPVGCIVAISDYAVHRNPDIFPDPEVFDPQRFLPENTIGRHPFAYIPFSAGPRNCIGQKFALLEEKVVLSTLLRKLKFELTVDTKPTPGFELLLKPKGGIQLKISPR